MGSTQSITFIAAPEVHQCILDLRGHEHRGNIDSSDVIYWLLEQTCCNNEELQQLYLAQGVDFCQRTQSMCENINFIQNPKQKAAVLNVLRQPEHQTLEELYKPSATPKYTLEFKSTVPNLSSFADELNERRKESLAYGVDNSLALEEVEQEKEVAVVVEEVREKQTPVHFTALEFPGLNPAILHFAKTGELVWPSAAYDQAITALEKSELGKKYGVRSIAPDFRLYVSAEFMRTVMSKPKRSPNDNFLVSELPI